MFSFSLYVEEKLGTKYVEKRTIPFEISYKESGPATPVFFVLSPGVDPLKDVEALGNKMNFTVDNKNFHNVSLGQVRRERERRERGREETEKRKRLLFACRAKKWLLREHLSWQLLKDTGSYYR